jgi:hypothetical protein
MTTVAQSACLCDTIGAPPEIRLCVEHHRYWLGDKKLESVSSVIRDTWPLKKSFEAADPAVLEHARERGIRVDRYASEYVKTGRLRIMAGEWEEVVNLTRKFSMWGCDYVGHVVPQAILHDGEIAGTCDFLGEFGHIYDLKTVYNLDPTYKLQMGAYADLYERMLGEPASGITLLHLTARFDTVREIPLTVDDCKREWRIVREMWELTRRLK